MILPWKYVDVKFHNFQKHKCFPVTTEFDTRFLKSQLWQIRKNKNYNFQRKKCAKNITKQKSQIIQNV